MVAIISDNNYNPSMKSLLDGKKCLYKKNFKNFQPLEGFIDFYIERKK